MVHKHIRGHFLAAAVLVAVTLLTTLLPPSKALAATCAWTTQSSVTCNGLNYSQQSVNGTTMNLVHDNCNTMVINNYKAAKPSASVFNGSFDIHTSVCNGSPGTVKLTNSWSDVANGGGNSCPGIDQTGVNCASIPMGCPGTTRQGPIATNQTLKCPYPPSAGSSWKCPVKSCVFNSTGKTVAQGQGYPQTCSSDAVQNSDGSCSCSDGSPQPANGNCPATSNTTCGGGNWDWAICPTDTLLQTIVKGLTDFYKSELTIQTSTIFTGPTGDSYYRAWNSFRIIGTALLVIAGLVMVSSQAFGFEVLDAYTIRKVLPRLLVAIIGMSLSWPLLNFIINFFNTLGLDIQQLMYAPFSTLPNHAGLSDGIVSWGLIIAFTALMAKGYGGAILPIMGTGALAMLIGIVIIIIRQIGVILLVIIAPLAVASYVLPNTKKLWDLWKDNFLGLMVMFPIVMAFIAAGQIFSQVGKSGNFVQQLVGIVAYFVPFFLIPLAFRMATGLISTITGFVNDRSKGGFDRLKNARQSSINHANEHNKKQLTAWRAKKYGEWQSAGGLRRRTLARVVGGRDMYQTHAGMQAAAKKQADELTSNGIDDELRALTARRDKTSSTGWRSLAGKEVNEAAVKRAQSRWGHDVYMKQEALAYEMRKASTEAESQSIAANYANLAEGTWHMSDEQATGAWIGAAFANQNQHLEYKNMRIQTDAAGKRTMGMSASGQGTFVDEIYENRGSYNMASMRSNTIEQLKTAYSDATAQAQLANDVLTAGVGGTYVDTNGATQTYTQQHMDQALQSRNAAVDQRQKIQAVAETFMHEAGYGGGVVAQPGDDQPPITSGGTSRRQANTPGAAHVAERVRELAEMAGVGPNGSAPSGSYGPGHSKNTPGNATNPNRREQN